MAKGNREVSLVIRAKNEASKALGSITASLDQMRESQRKTQDSAGETGSTLQQLGKTLGTLQRAISGSGGAEKFAGDLAEAKAAADRLEASLAALTAEQRQLNTEMSRSDATATRLAARQQQLTDRLRSYQQNAATAKARLAELNAEIRRGEQAGVQTDRLSGQMRQQATAVERLRTRYRELLGELNAVEQPSAALRKEFGDTVRALRQQETALAKTGASYQEHTAATQQLRASLPQLRQEQQQVNATFERSSGAVSETRRALGYVNTAVKETAASQSSLQRALAKTDSSMDRQAKNLAEVRQELGQLSTTGEQVDATLDKIGATVRGELLRSLQQSRQELERYRTTWQQAQQAIRASAQTGGMAPGGMGPPTADMQQQLNVARAAKEAYDEQREAIQRMRTALRAAGTDTTALAAAQQTFEQSQQRLEQRIKALAAAQNQQGAAAARTASASDRAATAATRQAAGHRGVSQALRQQAGASREAANGMEVWLKGGRTSLSLFQRLRGELLALAAAYVGLFGAIQALGGVSQTFQDIEAANNKMMVAMQGDQALAAREMRWIREEADRLGVQFNTLAMQYANLATATRGTNIEGAQTRKIFQQVTEAGRVFRLSNDQLQGVFKALEQMASRGTVSMEELREQLGDRLPGAFRLAVEAMGMTSKELTKMIENGELASEDFLPKFAQRLSDVTKPQLPKALESFNAALGRFQNEIVKAQEAVANNGFIDGMAAALENLTTFFQSSSGQKFFKDIGTSAGNFVETLSRIPEALSAYLPAISGALNVLSAGFETLIRLADEVILLLSLFVGQRILSGIASLGQRFRQAAQAALTLPPAAAAAQGATQGMAGAQATLNAQTAAAPPLMARMRAGLMATSIAMTTVQGRALAASRALAGLRAAYLLIGGLPGLILTGLATAVYLWSSNTESVIDATGEHERQLQRLLDEYGRVEEAGGDWLETIKEGIDGISLSDFRNTLRVLSREFEAERESLTRQIAGRMAPLAAAPGPDRLDETERLVVELNKALQDGGITAAKYQKEIDGILASGKASKRLTELVESSGNFRQALVESEQKLLDQASAVLALGGTIDELSDAQREAVRDFVELARGGARFVNEAEGPLERITRQMEEMRGELRGVGSEMRRMAALQGLDEIIRAAEAADDVDLLHPKLQRLYYMRLQNMRDMRAIMAEANEINDPLARVEFDQQRRQQDARLGDDVPREVFVERRVEDLRRQLVGGEQIEDPDRLGELLDSERQTASMEFDAEAQKDAAKAAERRAKDGERAAKAMAREAEKAREYVDDLDRGLARRAEELAVGEELTREIAIRRALEDEGLAAQRAGVELDQQRLTRIRQIVGAEYDRQAALRQQAEREEEINRLQQMRRDLLEMIDVYQRDGNVEALAATQAQLEQTNVKLLESVRAWIAYWESVGGPEAEAKVASFRLLLAQIENDLAAAANRGKVTAFEIGEAFGSQLSTGLDNWLSKIRDSGDVFGSLRESFLQFASDFLLQIAQMIAQAALFNAVQSVSSGGRGGAIGQGILAAISHDGGIVGAAGPTRSVSPGWFSNAMRYHGGGIAGLRPGEVPSILERGEEVLTRDDPRHAANGGGGQPAVNLKNVNVFNSADVMEQALADQTGQKVMLNWVRSNSSAIRGNLGV